MTLDPDHGFGWTRFYMEFADKLLVHRDDRSDLVEATRSACNSLGFNYLDSDRFPDGTRGPIKDICPFTTMATFNRGIVHNARFKIASDIGSFLHVVGPRPASFDGIPVVNNQKSWFFNYSNRRGEEDIDILWQVFADAIEFANSGSAADRRSFINSFDRALSLWGVARNLTMGLYWIRPQKFLPLDGRSEEFIVGSLGINLPRTMPPPGIQYLEIIESLNGRFDDAKFPVGSFQELSLAAYQRNIVNQVPQPQITVPSDETEDPPVADRIAEAIPTQPPVDREVREYSIQSIIDDGCFLEEDQLKVILDRLKSKKNLILQGPPGTGKTWLSKKLAFALIGQQSHRHVRPLQFHPNTSYEDFIRGYRPRGSNLTLVDGPFLELVTTARRDSTSDYVMVIEEINRGNPAQIFGEMLTLLEADKRDSNEALVLAYPKSRDERLHIPPNVYVIGTMNVADRSIAMVDLALRRRFAFVDLEPVFGEVWRNWVNDKCDIPLDFLESIEQRMTSLNDQIAADRTLGPQFRIGHSYVTPPEDESISDLSEWFRQVVDTEIGPLLDEYWFDDTQKAESAKSELLADL